MALRVLIVDDSAVMRDFLHDVLATADGIEVVGKAGDAVEARELINRHTPDAITLDVEMPGTSGIEFLERLMRLRPLPVVMVSSLTQVGAETTFRALEAGAVDFVAKPLSDEPEVWMGFAQELVAKVRAAVHAILPPPDVMVEPPKTGVYSGEFSLVAVGGSTGSVPIIQNLLQALPVNAPPMAIAVHMPSRFTTMFAQRLDSLSAVRVKEAEDGDVFRPGMALIARGGMQFRVARVGRDLVCKLAEEPRFNGHLPSVDVLFDSVARLLGADAAGLVLSGMGNDGAKGMLAMRAQGAVTAVQDEGSCVIAGMPAAALRAGGVLRVLDPSEMAAFVMGHNWVKAHRPTGATGEAA